MSARLLSRTLFAAAAVAASIITVSPAIAGVDGFTRSKTVSFADLDLDTEEGRATLGKRLVRASEYVCGSERGVSLRAYLDILNCREDALSNARRAMVTVIARADSNADISVAAGGR